MQINRLFEIVYLLLNKGGMTAEQLAERFEVSRRTVLRDVETLSAAGVPVYSRRGRGGGIYLLEGCVLDKTAVTEEEQNQILFALQSLNAARHVEAGETLAKLSALFDKDTDWIEVDFSRWGAAEEDREKFNVLRACMIKRAAVSFTYAGASGEVTRRKAYPLKLVFKSMAWYLQAYCTARGDYRTFKVNRMTNLEQTGETFPQGKYFPPPPDSFTRPAQSPLIPLRLRFPARLAYRVYDEFETGCVTREEDGSFLVEAALPEDDWLYGFLLSLGNQAEVLSPPFVRERLLRCAKDIEKLYS